MVADHFERRARITTWPRITPAEVLPVAGLMTGHAYITQFIETTWSPPCATTPQ